MLLSYIKQWHVEFNERTRVGRLSYFIQSLAIGLIYTVFAVAMAVSLHLGDTTNSIASYVLIFATAIFFICACLWALWVQLTLMMQRLHDFDVSGWWIVALFIAQAIPFIGLAALFTVMLVPGTSGDNRFGPQPK